MSAHSPIPKKLWQTYATAALPVEAAQCQASWRALNPDCDYHFSDDAAADAFMRRHTDTRGYAVYRALPLAVMRADMWRYCVLLAHGGVYSDIDTTCLAPVASWLEVEAAAIVGLENTQHFCQWTIACTPQHPLLAAVIERIVARAWAEGIDTTSEHFVHETTGPKIWTEAIAEYVGMPGATAKQVFDRFAAALAPGATRFTPQRFFQGDKVTHRYGSKTFSSNYAKWIDLRRQVPKGKIRPY